MFVGGRGRGGYDGDRGGMRGQRDGSRGDHRDGSWDRKWGARGVQSQWNQDRGEGRGGPGMRGNGRPHPQSAGYGSVNILTLLISVLPRYVEEL